MFQIRPRPPIVVFEIVCACSPSRVPRPPAKMTTCMSDPSGTTVDILRNVMHPDLMAVFDNAVIVDSHMKADVGKLPRFAPGAPSRIPANDSEWAGARR